MGKKSPLAVCLLLSLVACARGAPVRAPAPVVAAPSASPAEETAPSDPPAPTHTPLKDVEFDREFEAVDYNQADDESACTFNVSESFSYDGLLYFKGRPLAKADSFGKIKYGEIYVGENDLFARSSLTSAEAHFSVEVHLPEVSLYANGPIVHDDWLHITRTRIASKTSVKGAFFAPDVQLHDGVRFKTPLREDAYRIPCSMVSPNPPESATIPFSNGELVVLEAPDTIVGISKTPDGPAVAEIVKPQSFELSLLGMYKTTALVAVSTSSPASEVTLVGWIHAGTLSDGGGGIGLGNVGTIGHAAGETYLECDSVPIFVSVDHKLYSVAELGGNFTFRGAAAPNGDFRVDLGADPKWSITTPTKDGPKAALDPFIPKEYLVRCAPSKD